MPPLLIIENVSKSFGGLDALKDVNFAVHQGQIKALIGPTAPARRLCSILSLVHTSPVPGGWSFPEWT
jgi:putative multiple sugar transport system ATP-binding protein